MNQFSSLCEPYIHSYSKHWISSKPKIKQSVLSTVIHTLLLHASTSAGNILCYLLLFVVVQIQCLKIPHNFDGTDIGGRFGDSLV